MGDEEQATLDGQFYDYAKLLDNKRDGTTITLYRSDFWMRQAKLLDDRKLTMTDTGIIFNKFSKTELTFDEWMEFLGDLCEYKNLEREKVEETLTNCGLPGQTPVVVPQYRDFFLTYKHVLYCEAVFDSYLCWPPTPAGEEAYQNCPPARLSDTTRSAYRRCGLDGLWLSRRPNETSPIGWTNYTPCFPAEVQTLFVMVYDDEKDGQLKMDIAQGTRYMEIAGFSISLIALILSLVIFGYYRSLRNNRTRIHQCLFSAMVGQVIIRLILYIDQALVRNNPGDHANYENVTMRGIDNMPYLCESSYVLLEYAVTAMFMWMFIEGLYLHSVVAANTLRNRISHVVYHLLGWGVPAVITATWAVTTAFHYYKNKVKSCWFGYNFNPLYWIVQGPRLAVIMINMVFLLNIMRVLIIKLKRSQNSELQMTKKAVRAALVLLPLLGITNVLNMIEAPLDGSVVVFALWSYGTHFLRSFQGFFIALLYCFLNGEVKYILRKHYEDYMAMRVDIIPRHRDSSLRYATAVTQDTPRIEEPSQRDEECIVSFEKMRNIKPPYNCPYESDGEMETELNNAQEMSQTGEGARNLANPSPDSESFYDAMDGFAELFSMDI